MIINGFCKDVFRSCRWSSPSKPKLLGAEPGRQRRLDRTPRTNSHVTQRQHGTMLEVREPVTRRSTTTDRS